MHEPIICSSEIIQAAKQLPKHVKADLEFVVCQTKMM